MTVNLDYHHLIPKQKGGKNKDKHRIHKVCHRLIHAVFTNVQLKKQYHTWEALKEHEDIQNGVEWIQKKLKSNPHFLTSFKDKKK